MLKVFSSKEQEVETTVGPSVKVEGNFVSKGNIIVEGQVVGSLKTEKDLRVGENAKIAANISAANAFIAGEIKGNVKAKDRLELSSTSKIFGDVEAKVLIINAGAILNGRCAMQIEGLQIPLPEASVKKNDKKIPNQKF
jgi:cytoskeletal protein CcmA (bactofilin family)